MESIEGRDPPFPINPGDLLLYLTRYRDQGSFGIGFLVHSEIVKLRSLGVGARYGFDGFQDQGPEMRILDGFPAGTGSRSRERNSFKIVGARFQPAGRIIAVPEIGRAHV